jgi:hypothetical protein
MVRRWKGRPKIRTHYQRQFAAFGVGHVQVNPLAIQGLRIYEVNADPQVLVHAWMFGFVTRHGKHRGFGRCVRCLKYTEFNSSFQGVAEWLFQGVCRHIPGGREIADVPRRG